MIGPRVNVLKLLGKGADKENALKTQREDSLEKPTSTPGHDSGCCSVCLFPTLSKLVLSSMLQPLLNKLPLRFPKR